MTASNLSLFGDDPPAARCARPLVVRPAAGRPLDKKAQAFNRLLGRVHALQQQFEREKSRLDDALVFHAAEVRPRMERLAALREEVVRGLQPFLDDSRLKPADREILADILAGQLDELLATQDTLDQDLQDLFERLNGVTVADVAQEQMSDAKAAMAAMFADLGLDMEVPDLRADMSEEEVAATVATMADRMRRAEEERRSNEPPRGRTKRQRKQEEQAQRFEDLRKIGIGGVYKRLVKALHPDRESDAGLRERKSAMMREVTTAYARNDLHALLRLELEWVGGDHLDAARLTDETLAAYTALLKEQVAELEAACVELPFHPRYADLVGPDDGLGSSVAIDGPATVERLTFAIDGLTAALERMAAGQAWREVRGLIQDYKRAMRVRRRY
jgi:hypothetical protein